MDPVVFGKVTNKVYQISTGFHLVGESGFEPLKSSTTDLQSAPFGRSGTLPYSIKWSWWTDSNPRPADYKSAALPTELHQQIIVTPTSKEQYNTLF